MSAAPAPHRSAPDPASRGPGTTPRPQPPGAHRPPRRARPLGPPPTAADRRRARATIPCGDAHGQTGRPAVDADIWLLHVLYERTRSTGLLGELVEEYRPWALSVARRSTRGDEPFEDLGQVAMEALVKALVSFDCGRSVPFIGMARPNVVGALKRHFRDHGWAVRVPREVHELASANTAVVDLATARTGTPPARAARAAALGVEEAAIDRIDRALLARRSVSLDAPVAPGSDAPRAEVPVHEPHFALVEGRADLVGALETLADADRQVVGLSYFDGLSQREIGLRLGMSQMQVSRRLAAGLAQLRSRMRPSDRVPRSTRGRAGTARPGSPRSAPPAPDVHAPRRVRSA